MALQADVGSFLLQLSQGLSGYSCDPEWPQQLRERDEEKEKQNVLVKDPRTGHDE